MKASTVYRLIDESLIDFYLMALSYFKIEFWKNRLIRSVKSYWVKQGLTDYSNWVKQL